MAGKIKSEGRKIHIQPPDYSFSYILELEDTDHIKVWIDFGGERFATSHIPFDVIPFMSVLMNRRREENKILTKDITYSIP